MAGEIESCVEETSCGVSLRQIRDRVRQYIDKVGVQVYFRKVSNIYMHHFNVLLTVVYIPFYF